MKTSLYTVTIPVFINTLTALRGILDKAIAFAEEKGMDPDAFLTKQLAPDMFPFVKQVQVACDQAKGFPFRAIGVQPPAIEDSETKMIHLQARINQTINILGGVAQADIDAAEENKVTLPFFPGKHLTAFGYAVGYSLPNFFFHVTTAYDILRHEGVPLGKADFVSTISTLLIDDVA